MAVKYFTKPFFVATLICIFVFYSGIVKIPEAGLHNSILPKEKIFKISGMLIDSPVKASNGKNYSAKFRVKNLYTADFYDATAVCQNSDSIIKVYIPSELIEVYFPGKLYSSGFRKGSFLYESGGNYTFSGRFFEKGFSVQKCMQCSWENGLTGKIDYIRAVCRLHFKRLMFSFGNAGGLLLALLSGEREYTETETAFAFRKAGLSHILALSGMHLSMFSAIAVFFGNKTGRKKLTLIIRVAALLIFVWFAGFSPSLLRAFICSMLLIFAGILGIEKPDMIMILCFSFMLHSILAPQDLKNYGFILSYSALAGILFFSKAFFKLFSKFLPSVISASLGASCGAQLFTLPVSLKLFGSFAPAGVIATVIISPLITIFIYSGIFLIIMTLIFPIIFPCSEFFMCIQYNIIKILVKIFSQFPIWSIN